MLYTLSCPNPSLSPESGTAYPTSDARSAMRGTALPSAPSRIKGRASLVRRLRALLIAAHRFGQHRAVTVSELAFAGRLVEGLNATLTAAEDVETRVSSGAPRNEVH